MATLSLRPKFTNEYPLVGLLQVPWIPLVRSNLFLGPETTATLPRGFRWHNSLNDPILALKIGSFGRLLEFRSPTN